MIHDIHIYDSGVLSFKLSLENIVLCIIDISLCALLCQSWFNCFRNNLE